MNTLFWHRLVDDIYLDLNKWWFVIKNTHDSYMNPFKLANSLKPQMTSNYALEFGGFENTG